MGTLTPGEGITLSGSKLQDMHNIIMELFLSSCNILVKEDLEDHEYQYCLDTIHNTLSYIGSRRKEKKYKILKDLKDWTLDKNEV